MKLTDNQYTDGLFSLYEVIYLEKKTPSIRKSLIKKENIITYPQEVMSIMETINKVINSLENEVMNFTKLSRFADFIRVLEKVFFYSNEPKKDTVVCDSPWDANRKEIIINKGHYKIILNMEYDYDALANKTTIKVIRNFGLKLTNNFVVFENDMEFNDESDLMLINNLNRIIGEEFANLYRTYYKKILNGDI